MRSRLRFACASACALALSLAATTAAAQASPDSAKAEALFREGNRLLAKKRYPEACAKFAESKRLEPGIGVTLYLGDCYEHVGRTASAWAEFSAAEDAARLAHDGRARLAHDRAAQLEARLSKVILVVAPSAESAEIAGLDVKQDGVAVGRAQWGVALPVDPGDHRFDATAPNHRAWTRTVHVAEGPLTTTLDVPALALEPAAAAPVAATPEPSPAPHESAPDEPRADSATGTTSRVLGLTTIGVGLVAVGAGAVFGLAAKSKLESSNANGLCNASDHCTPDGLAARSDGMRDATISTVAFSVGAAALVGGALLYLTAPHARPAPSAPVDVSGAFGPAGGRVVASVRF